MIEWITSGTWSLDANAKQRLQAALNETRGSCVLDVGCRDGTFALTLARERPGITVHGIDTDASAILWASKTAEENKIENAVFWIEDLLKPIALRAFKEHFSTVVCMETLEHLPPESVPAAFDTLRSYCKKDGRLLISVPANSHISDPDHKTTFYREFFSKTGKWNWVKECPWLWIMVVMDGQP